MSDRFRVGDRVRLLRDLPLRKPVRAGSVGVVVVGDDGEAEPRTTLAVAFTRGINGAPYQAVEVFRRHLALVSPAPAEGSA
jgi:hypothetical protein